MFYSINFSSYFEKFMSKDKQIIKQYALSTIDVGDPLGEQRVLVLYTNGEMKYLDPCDKKVFNKATQIKANDGTHVDWKLFPSHTAMESFIKDTRTEFYDRENVAKLGGISEPIEENE